MAKKRRRTTSTRSLLSYFDWSIHPDTAREIVAVIFGVIGLVGLLALAGKAGSVGLRFNTYFTTIVGVVHYLVPLAFLGIGAVLWNPDRYAPRWTMIGGLLLFFLMFPALLHPLGGTVGEAFNDRFSALIGDLGSIVALFGLVVTSLLLIFNTSLRRAWEILVGTGEAEPQIHDSSAGEARVSVFQAVRDRLTGGASADVAQAPVATLDARSVVSGKPVTGSAHGDWTFPPLDLLSLPTGKATAGNVVKNVETIEKTLKDFGIEVQMGDVNIGPTVTQYTLKPAEGVKLTAITARANDLALALAAPSIRIEAPIPGKGAVGIEVPNKVPATVTLREVLETDEFKAVKSDLTLALGRDAAGAPVSVDLKKMPHLLIAGATGSGKSIAINTIIASLLYQNTPDQLRLLLIDPKRVEFTPYNEVPHLLAPVITEPDKTVNTLKWAIVEMERRYRQLQEVGSRDIASYNAKHKDAPLPYIVFVIDELADLMQQSAKEVEGGIVRLAQMARAVGMHLIVATQRPSVDVITGLIKANITTRMAFAVASQVDSRTIIDIAGAEKLLGNGDMLYLAAEFTGKPRRVQGCLITEKEVEAVTGFLKEQAPAQYDDEVMNFSPRGVGSGLGGDGGGSDELFDEARTVVVQAGKASASLLQRRLRIGYARAARLLDILEEHGIIGPADGAKPRDVLVGLDSMGGHDFPTQSDRGSGPSSPTGPRPPRDSGQF
ncbi:DNA translocase FtsK 4TM domain-containing protein [Candidatus Berkelbacteria bacterium]|nr:DNA translocase FtsK 4TM domain-containing protein [Candidatus Berkelbacteria bacterium]